MSKIKDFVKKSICFFLPIRNIILFESAPDLSDNTKAVFDEMVKRGLNKRYKLVWWIDNKNSACEKIENVLYIDRQKHKLKWWRYTAMAKTLICCNRYLVPVKAKQKAFYLAHGTPCKSVKSYYTVPKEIQYVLSAGEKVSHFLIDEMHCREEQIFCLGYPRNDVLTQPTVDLKPYFGTTCKKIIAWYPTFRQHSAGSTTASKITLPIIHDEEKAKALNEYAKAQDVLLILKPHFAQDVSYIKDLGLSNICFIDDSFFMKNGLTSYKFIASCDAVVTDYSSIYFDFTLCDKPVAAIWEDIEDYKKNPGLVENYEYYMKGAEKIYTLEEFKAFLYNVANDLDPLKKERNEIKVLVNYSDDGKNSERVVDFIIEKAGL